MKKERIVKLCICVVLSAGLQSLFFSAIWIRLLHVPAYSRAVLPVRSNIMRALAVASWPPLGFLELRLLHERMEGILHSPAREAGQKGPEQLAHHNELERRVNDRPLRTR